MKQFILNDVKTEVLRKMLGISMSVSKSETLNFTIDGNKIVGVTNNISDSIYKRWEIGLSDICTPEEKAVIPLLKCSIYKGEEFSKKILSYFGQLVNLRIEHDDSEVKKIELFKLNEAGKVGLKINLVTASSSTAFVDYDPEVLSMIFYPTEETKLFGFELDTNDLSEVGKLSKLSTNPEEQTDYVTLYSADGSLKATDNAFDVILKEGFTQADVSIDIDKDLWSMIDRDSYEVEIHQVDEENKILVCKSTTKNVINSLVLLGKTDDSVDFNDFEMDNSTFE